MQLLPVIGFRLLHFQSFRVKPPPANIERPVAALLRQTSLASDACRAAACPKPGRDLIPYSERHGEAARQSKQMSQGANNPTRGLRAFMDAKFVVRLQQRPACRELHLSTCLCLTGRRATAGPCRRHCCSVLRMPVIRLSRAGESAGSIHTGR